MRCEHAQTTTLLWLYGEASDAHAAHVAGCAECSAVLAEHEALASALGPALAAISAQPDVVPAPTRPRRRRRTLATALAVAAAAAGVGAFVGVGQPVGPLDSPGGQPVAAVEPGWVPAPGEPDPFDAALDDLDRELEWLSQDLERL